MSKFFLDHQDNYQNNYQSCHNSQSWQKLEQLASQPWSLSQLFLQDVNENQPNTQSFRQARQQNFVINELGVYFDYSKQLVNNQVVDSLLALADDQHLKKQIDALLQGKKVNNSENREALHTALRLPKQSVLMVDGNDVVADVHQSLEQTKKIVNRIRGGIWRGYSGKAITDVINLGVGGSDLGPLMITSALDEWADTDICVHFVSNMDGSQLEGLLKKLNPESSLFIIASKSFGTLDTLSNAKTALAWLCQFAPKTTVLHRHFISVSANVQKATKWGIYPENQLKIWDWVGGRFSLWSAIGLAVAIRIGMDSFYQLLAGAHAMDEHFANTDFRQNMPVMMGLIGVWNSTFLKINAHTVLPYDGRLKFLPSYLTQLEMESNGKSVTKKGEVVNYDTCPILWGEVGSNAQHAFYQLLHQGTQKVSCDFIACVERYKNSNGRHASVDVKQTNKANHSQTLQQQHWLSLANCLAQSRVLAFGNQASDEAKNNSSQNQLSQNKPSIDDRFKNYHGNQPSTTILLDALTPYSLGSLIALYEHKVFVMASIWGINPFDQWGVEMGKKVAGEVYDCFDANINNDDLNFSFDASTNQLMKHIMQNQYASEQNNK
ncbi:MAG: glucose-6-phosphate isomerase [Gammaproteobacteria bacterium]|nr:MAG: glucose-6-phosphate isomerase [Gammaproteobacteria bacterium]